MYRKLVLLLLIFMSQNALSEETVNSNNDPRTLVTMPDQARNLMRQDMLNNLSALNQIIAFLADNKFDEAAELSETILGRSAMGKYRGTGMGPGRFMTPEMRNIGWNMHEAASEFSIIAKQGDLKSAYSALPKITSTCVACHAKFRTR